MTFASTGSVQTPEAGEWWQGRGYAALLVLLATVPLLWPPIPPLTDLLGHMGRYHIELEVGRSPYLHQWYSFRWELMGNLGVDLLIVPMAKLFGLELGVKLIALSIPALTVYGLLLIAREVHGRLPPTAAFALPLAYGFPFQFGFINFALSMALALIAFGWWLRLGRLGRIRLRAALFVPIGAAIWVAHSYGWGFLGLLAFSAEVVERWRRGDAWWLALWRGGWACLPLAPPLLLMIAWRSEKVAGGTADFLNWTAKKAWILAILRERDAAIDLVSAFILYGIAIAGLFRVGGVRTDGKLGLAAAVLLIAFLTLPRILLGSAYADMRLAPFMTAIALIAIGQGRIGRQGAGVIAALALAFYVGRLANSTYTYVERSQVYSAQLEAIDHIPRGARVMVFVDLPCQGHWQQARTDHLGALAIIRRDAFVNGQWDMPGAQLLRVTYRAAGKWGVDPSQVRRPPNCSREPVLSEAIELFPRAAFDYLWLIGLPPRRFPHDPWLRPVWRGRGGGVLYRITGSATAPIETPNGSRPRATT